MFAALAAVGLAFAPGGAFASGPAHWELWHQEPASASAERIFGFHHMLLWIISAITVFVLVLLLIVIVRFNRRANPVPSTTTHHTMLEVVWTVVPVVILVVIAVPSFKLLYYVDRTADPEMTLKVTGFQWYWGYAYPDYDGLTFDARMIPDADIDASKGQLRLLSTDNPVVLPIETNIAIQVTAQDVIHSFAVPALGLKLDAMPGRLNETWVRIEKPGVYYGQCSELCGKDHAFMPIEIHAVTKEEFKVWIEKAKEQFSWNLEGDGQPVRLAMTEVE